MEGGDSCLTGHLPQKEDSDPKNLKLNPLKETPKKWTFRRSVTGSGDGFRSGSDSEASTDLSSDFVRLYFGFEPICLPSEPSLNGIKIDNFKTVVKGTMERSVGGRMPVISATSNGVITVQLSNDLDIDLSIEQNVRVRSPLFTAMSSANNRCTALIHESGMLLHDGRIMNGFFPVNSFKTISHNAVIGPSGIVFSSSNSSLTYFMDTECKVTPIDSVEVDFPNMQFDFASSIFFSKCPFSKKRLERCQFWLKTATVSRMRLLKETHYQISIGPLLIVEDADGNVEITCSSQKIFCNSRTGQVEIRNANKVYMTADVNGISSMKMDKKRVHASCSGLLASEGGTVASLNAFGEFGCY
ncbi:unnamed protein product [Bursaphelenchus xylophilus]|nr:unnamed protein product [Bursaphelenchus xylophilus]CAG9085494.1 unnamed protein product [Bursaphelenchus xylophilus]